jgi:hypothetical protein
MRKSIMALIMRLGTLIATVVLTGCGTPPPDPSAVSEATGSAGVIHSAPAGDAPKTSSGPNAPARQAPTQTSLLGPIAQPVSPPKVLVTGTTGTPCLTPDTHAQTAAFPAEAPPSDERVEAKCAQREARISWDAEMREHPDGTGRLQAMALVEEQLNDEIEPVTYRLVDEDERVLAQELREDQFVQEVEIDTP